MKLFTGIPAETVVTPAAETLRLYHAGYDRAALVLHGYTGYVGDMRYLAEHIHSAGFNVLAPRLPGHGTNSVDFCTTGAREWLRAAQEGYLELAGKHREVMVTGLSMGGVLSVLVAAHFPVTRVALLAPALDFVNRLVPFTPFLGFLVPPYRKNSGGNGGGNENGADTPEDPEVQYLTSEYWDWNWPRQAGHLYALARSARRALPRVTAPTLTIVARNDDAVPPRVADRIKRSIGAAVQHHLILEESGHVITNGPEREIVARAVTDWFLSKDKD